MSTERLKTIFIDEINGITFNLKIEPKGSSNKHRLEYNFEDPVTGKQVRKKTSKNLGTKKSEKELIKSAKGLVEFLSNAFVKGYSPITKSIVEKGLTPNSTITECVKEYLDVRRKEYEAGVLDRFEKYKITLNVHFTKWLEQNNYEYRKPASFVYSDFVNFLAVRAKQKKWLKHTYNDNRNNLKTFWIWLKEKGVVHNYDGISKVEAKNTRKDSTQFVIYEEDELTKITNSLKGNNRFSNLYIHSKLIYLFNIREEEQLKLQVQDYNPKTKILNLPADKSKNGDEANFLLNDELVELIEKQIEGQPKEYYIFSKGNKAGAYRMAKGAITQRWATYRRDYNISTHLKIYALKHTSSYYALEVDGSMDLTKLQAKLRHSDPNTTKNYATDKLNRKPITGGSDGRF